MRPRLHWRDTRVPRSQAHRSQAPHSQAPRSQALLKALLDKPLKEKDANVQGLLLCGLYQLEHMRIPDHAAVGETVAATRALKKSWAKGLTNAVLRRFLRERPSFANQHAELCRRVDAVQCVPSMVPRRMRGPR